MIKLHMWVAATLHLCVFHLCLWLLPVVSFSFQGRGGQWLWECIALGCPAFKNVNTGGAGRAENVVTSSRCGCSLCSRNRQKAAGRVPLRKWSWRHGRDSSRDSNRDSGRGHSAFLHTAALCCLLRCAGWQRAGSLSSLCLRLLPHG